MAEDRTVLSLQLSCALYEGDCQRAMGLVDKMNGGEDNQFAYALAPCSRWLLFDFARTAPRRTGKLQLCRDARAIEPKGPEVTGKRLSAQQFGRG